MGRQEYPGLYLQAKLPLNSTKLPLATTPGLRLEYPIQFCTPLYQKVVK